MHDPLICLGWSSGPNLLLAWDKHGCSSQPHERHSMTFSKHNVALGPSFHRGLLYSVVHDSVAWCGTNNLGRNWGY